MEQKCWLQDIQKEKLEIPEDTLSAVDEMRSRQIVVIWSA
jgi:hypothetical protein